MDDNTRGDEIVRVAQGTAVVVRLWQQLLKENGIAGRVVGDELNASIGSALGDASELWVHKADAEKASELIAAAEEEEARREQARG